MALKQALGWSGVQTAVRMVLSFLSIKVTAVYLGPVGLALVGQLGNFLNLVQGVISGAIQTGVVTLTAEADDEGRRARVWGTAMRMGLWLSLGAAFGVLVLSGPLAQWLLDDREYWPMIALTAACVVFAVLSMILTAILNGLRQIRLQSLAAIATAISGALLFIPLSYFFGIPGGLAGTALAYACAFFVGLIFAGRAPGLRLRDLTTAWDGGIAREIARFYPMLLANAAALPLALILVRDLIGGALGLEQAGYWQAVWRVSEMYTQVLSTALGLYLIAHLSAIDDSKRFAQELRKVGVNVAALTLVCALAIFVARDLVISIVFTPKFAPIRSLFLLQLVGDVFKMASWPLRMTLTVKRQTAWYVAFEAGTPALFLLFTWMWLPALGANAATAGYAASYLVTVLALLLVLRKTLFPGSAPRHTA